MNQGVVRSCVPLIIMKNRSQGAAVGCSMINDLFNFPVHPPNYTGVLEEAPPSLEKHKGLQDAPSLRDPEPFSKKP